MLFIFIYGYFHLSVQLVNQFYFFSVCAVTLNKILTPTEVTL